jgi:hypothetical protein
MDDRICPNQTRYGSNLPERPGRSLAKLAKEAKAQGISMDYKVLSSEPSSKTDWNLILMFELDNYAALDSFDDKIDAQHTSAVSRNDMRDILGGRLARELIFK